MSNTVFVSTPAGSAATVPPAEIAAQVPRLSQAPLNGVRPVGAQQAFYPVFIDDTANPPLMNILVAGVYRTTGLAQQDLDRLNAAVTTAAPIAAANQAVLPVTPFRIYTLFDRIYSGIVGLANGQYVDFIAPVANSSRLLPNQDVSGVEGAIPFNIAAQIDINAGDVRMFRVTRIGNAARIDIPPSAAEFVTTATAQSINSAKNFLVRPQFNSVDIPTQAEVTTQINALNTTLSAQISAVSTASDPASIVRTNTAQTISGDKNFTGNLQIAGQAVATQAFVSQVASQLSWQRAVIDWTLVNPPSSPTTGDRYIVAGSGLGLAGGLWAGQDRKIAEWNGSAWTFATPSTGWAVFATTQGVQVIYSQTLWTLFSAGDAVIMRLDRNETVTGNKNFTGLLQQNGVAVATVASPTFTGTPAAPTASAGTNTTQIATTAFVTAAIAALIAAGTAKPRRIDFTPVDAATTFAIAYVVKAGETPVVYYDGLPLTSAMVTNVEPNQPATGQTRFTLSFPMAAAASVAGACFVLV